MDKDDVTNEDIPAEVSAWDGDTETEIPVTGRTAKVLCRIHPHPQPTLAPGMPARLANSKHTQWCPTEVTRGRHSYQSTGT
jgi:hypothetical protein